MDGEATSLMSRGAFWLMLRQVAVWAACVDGLYLTVFLLLDMPVVAWLNVLSAAMYAVAYWLLSRRINRPAVAIMWTEVLVHSCACTVLLGWDSGVHYFLLVFLPAVAVSRSIAATIGALAFLLAIYIALDAVTQAVPVIHTLDAGLLTAFRWLNITVVFTMFAFIARHYVFRVQKGEAGLRDMATMIERERIARELHDTVLQDVQALVLRFQSAMQKVPPNEPARAVMEAALEQADRVLVEGRDRLTGLRARRGAAKDLCEALAETGEELSAQYGPSFKLESREHKRHLRESAADEIYRIAREALLNAFQHARACHIRVEVGYGADRLTVRVRDDGIGFDPRRAAAAERAQHWGVVGMRERAGRLGAELSIAPHPQGGTLVYLCVPATRAYKMPTSTPRHVARIEPGMLSMECEQ